MKKRFLVVAVAAFAVSMFSSCKKDYNCTCSFTSAPDLIVPFDGYKKADAEDGCNSAETTYKQADSGASCTLTEK